MLRIRRRAPVLRAAAARSFKNAGANFEAQLELNGPGDAAIDVGEFEQVDEFEIVRVYKDAMLELLRLLREAANIEQALAVQYLYAGYSVKTEYFEQLTGTPDRGGSPCFMGVAIDEMHHLGAINRLLKELRSAPCFDREDFPFRSDIYPFEFSLERLTLNSLAKYVVAESPEGELDPEGTADPDEKAYRLAVAAALGGDPVNQIGSLYRTIKARLITVTQEHSGLIQDLDYWLKTLDKIIDEGEQGHYGFLKSVFKATHPAFAGNQDVWLNIDDAAYPSKPVPTDPTAFEETPRTISDPLIRRLAWLGDLQYWAVIGLLHTGYAHEMPELGGQALSHMLGGMHVLAEDISARGSALPFDAMSLNFKIGQTKEQSLFALRLLMTEIIALETELRDHLPLFYSKKLAGRTLKMVGG